MRCLSQILLGLLLLLSTDLLRSENIRFNYLSVAQGLSQNSVTALAQDSIGRIWIGTRDGLNVYDGTRIKNFRQLRGDPNSLLGHFVNDIKINGNDLWVVTKSGISHLNIKNYNFTSYPKEGVSATILYKGMTLVGTKTELLVLDTKNKTFQKSILAPKKTEQ